MSGFDAKKWKLTREMGRKRFILLYGVLAWGIPMAILTVLRNGYESGWDGWLANTIASFILFPFAGIFFGAAIWKITERRFAKAKADASNA